MLPNTHPKHVATLKNWMVAWCERPLGYILIGNIYGHPNEEDGKMVFTTKILMIDFVNKLAETKHSFYKLEEIASGDIIRTSLSN